MKSTPLLSTLVAMGRNRVDFPNIPTDDYESLQRNIQLLFQLTYGIRIQNPNELGTGLDVTVDFLVLAVHGTKNNTNPITSKNVVYLANQVFNPPPFNISRQTYKLVTPKNNNGSFTAADAIDVTVKQSLGNGAIAVNEDLFEDILEINSTGDGSELANKPFLRIVGPFR